MEICYLDIAITLKVEVERGQPERIGLCLASFPLSVEANPYQDFSWPAFMWFSTNSVFLGIFIV